MIYKRMTNEFYLIKIKIKCFVRECLCAEDEKTDYRLGEKIRKPCIWQQTTI